jgi:hypothetical protein
MDIGRATFFLGGILTGIVGIAIAALASDIQPSTRVYFFGNMESKKTDANTETIAETTEPAAETASA